LQELAHAFAVEVLAYAILSNHAHKVLRNRPDIAAAWTAEEVAARWLEIFPKCSPGQPGALEVNAQEQEAIAGNPRRVETLRRRLSDISWFMRALNESIARRANAEDGCKGRFWEGRFFSQRLLDEASILACMCYVDLNPVRAKLAESLGDSAFTSAYDRIMARQARERLQAWESISEEAAENASRAADAHVGSVETTGIDTNSGPQSCEQESTPKELQELKRYSTAADWLVDLDGTESPFSFLSETDYLRILEETGRQLRSDKPGAISPGVMPILEALGVDARKWVDAVRRYRSLFWRVAGRGDRMRELANRLGGRHFKGCVAGQSLYLPF